MSAGILIDILATGVTDNSGTALASGVAYIYEVGTTTKVAVYSDEALSTPVSNPVTLNAGGKAEVYVGQKVRIFIQSSAGATIDDIESFGGQVELDDVTADVIPSLDDTFTVGSTAKRFASGDFVDLTVHENLVATLLQRVGSNTPGWMNNLGISLASGVFSIVAADGTALSTTNPGYVTAPSATPGLFKSLKVTAGGTFNDDSHASSSLTNLGWGITETVNWANDMPFFLYVVNRNNNDITGLDGDSGFAIARSPVFRTTPSSANDIGTNAAIPVNDSQDVMLMMDVVTVANYVSLPCTLVGAFRMQWDTGTDDWTVQTLATSDGLGDRAVHATLAKTWTFPKGQNGAAASNHLKANGGTAPTWSTAEILYKLHRDGTVRVWVDMNGDGGTDGSGAVTLQCTIPYKASLALSTDAAIGSARISSIVTGVVMDLVQITTGNDFVTIDGQTGTALQNNDFTNGVRKIEFSVEYPAYAP